MFSLRLKTSTSILGLQGLRLRALGVLAPFGFGSTALALPGGEAFMPDLKPQCVFFHIPSTRYGCSPIALCTVDTDCYSISKLKSLKSLEVKTHMNCCVYVCIYLSIYLYIYIIIYIYTHTPYARMHERKREGHETKTIHS